MAEVNVQSTDTDIKINVGCGASPTPGWLNFDNSLSVRLARWSGVSTALDRLGRLRALGGGSADLVALAQRGEIGWANATAHIPCAAGSAVAVYSSHMIEHLDRAEARAFLAEVRRVLQPGGVLRVAAPDLSLFARDYAASGDADGFVSGIHMGLDRPAGVRGWMRWALVGPRHHLWMYDGESLSRLLGEAGFAEAAVMPAGTTRIAAPGQLNLRERETESVYVEAVRPR
jgi:SAM-dependent methyltransferase